VSLDSEWSRGPEIVWLETFASRSAEHFSPPNIVGNIHQFGEGTLTGGLRIELRIPSIHPSLQVCASGSVLRVTATHRAGKKPTPQKKMKVVGGEL
jgi:hypothetical protein